MKHLFIEVTVTQVLRSLFQYRLCLIEATTFHLEHLVFMFQSGSNEFLSIPGADLRFYYLPREMKLRFVMAMCEGQNVISDSKEWGKVIKENPVIKNASFTRKPLLSRGGSFRQQIKFITPSCEDVRMVV